MNINAIKRIEDYCCEFKQEQWEELVKVADEVGMNVIRGMMKPDKFVRYNTFADALGVYPDRYTHQETIPYPDFLAKLKGWDGEGDPFTSEQTLAMAAKACADKWLPKAGEMVETSVHGDVWHEREFIGKRNGFYVCWSASDSISTFPFPYYRPLRPTITREQAEKELNCKIKD